MLPGSGLPDVVLPDVVLPDVVLPDVVLPDVVLPDTGPPAPAEPTEVSPPVCAGESVLPGDAPAVDDEPLAGAVGLLAVEVTGDVVGWGDVLALAVGLPQMVPAFCLCCVLVPLVLVLALARVVVEALDVAVALPLALLVALGLPLPDTPVAGLGELGGGVDGPGEAGAAVEELDEAGVLLAEGVADDCVHDASGVGRRRWAAVAAEPPAPPAAAWPPRPETAGLVALAELVPAKAAATDELTACRSGGTEASTTPTANTTQARAMAGLIRPTRQSRRGLRPESPALCPARRAFQRRTMSASTPVLAGTALAGTALAGTALADTALADTALADTALADTARRAPTRVRIRSSPSGRGST